MAAQPTNLFQYYQGKNQALPSISERASQYAAAGLGKAADYTGTDEQNTNLLGYLNSSAVTSTPGGSPTGAPTGAPAQKPVTQTNTNSAPITPGLTEEDGGSAVSSSSPVTSQINTGAATDTQAQNSSSFASFAASVTPAGGPPPAPNYTSTYASLRASQGIDTIEDNINTLNQQAATLQAQLPAFEASAETGATSSGVFNARMSEEQRDIQSQLDVVNSNLNAANANLSAKNDFINTIMGYTQQDYTTANSAYETTLSDNMNLVSAFNTQQTKVQNSAQANLQTIYTLIQNSGMTWSQLSPSQQNQVTVLEQQAGLPVGTYATFAASKPKATIVSTSVQYDSNGQEFTSIISRDPQTGAYSTSNVYAGGQKQYNPDTTTSITQTGYNNIDSIISNPSEYSVDGQPYLDANGQWTAAGFQDVIENSGLSVTDIVAKYGSKLPSDAYQNPANYGLTAKDLAEITDVAPSGSIPGEGTSTPQ